MKTTLIQHARIIADGEIVDNHNLVITDDCIGDIHAADQQADRPNFDQVIDAGGKFLGPGFIDLHMHGVHKYCVDQGVEDLEQICRILPGYGVTGFLPTVGPRPEGEDTRRLARLAKVNQDQAARIYGFHLEGPFLSLTGALPPESLGQPSQDRVEKLIEAAKPYPAVFSISPEFPDIVNLLPIMTANHRPAFITHTRASVEQTLKAIAAGACHATHFYDVFHLPGEQNSGVRPCGAVEAILADPAVSVDFILDGVHVDPIAIKMALQCKGKDRVCLITDANIGAGLGRGKYFFGRQQVEVADLGAPARLVESKALAGSGLTMNLAVRNAVELLGITLPEAVQMASANPARVLKLEQTGMIKPGYKADLVLFDEAFKVVKTWVNGVCCQPLEKE